MPIIDPVLQIQLLNQLSKKNCNSKAFFVHYLRTASQNKDHNVQTVEASINFKNHLKNNINYLSSEFKCKFYTNKFDNLLIRDYYRYFYDHIDISYKNSNKKWKNGLYKHFIDKDGLQTNFFQPYVPNFCNFHSWFLSTTPIAILCIDFTQIPDMEQFLDLINLILFETDLMLASGFTLVLCAKLNLNDRYLTFISKELLFHSYFSEIHLNFTQLDQNDEKIDYEYFWETLKLENVDFKLYGYLYIYTKFIENLDQGTQNLFKGFTNFFRVNQFNFSKETNDVMMSMNVVDARPFPFCTNGFKNTSICVRLCNVPLYKDEDEEIDWSLSQTSGNTYGYILSEDFLNRKKSRVKIIIRDDINNCFCEKFVEFEDIHIIKTDFFVEKTLYLTDLGEETLDLVDKIKTDVEKKASKRMKFVREDFISFFQDKKFMKQLVYVTYAYVKYASIFIKGFDIHNNQIFTAHDASNICLFDNDTNSKGVVYQIETGEGKSCIIQIIAAVLALMKKTVHIVSSNITLANRDYHNSFVFFKQLELTSAVLLHYNELPFVSNESTYDVTYYPDRFFSKDLFENSINMNYSVCGVLNDKQLSKNKVNIVFSTIVNFECFYLKMMEMCPAYITKYFNECVLLIDEVDSILIDEITNGTIISKPIKSNAKDILIYVYESRIKGCKSKDVLNHIKENWPKCTDITVNDIENMFKEIDMVNQNDFIDGKKYSIETYKISKKGNLIERVKKNKKNDDVKEKEIKSADKEETKSTDKRKRKSTDKEEIKSTDKEEVNSTDKIKRKSTDKEEKVSEGKEKTREKKHRSSSHHKNKKKFKIFKDIIPFDYDHKGILEPNKEFNGYAHQFIAIKEMLTDEQNQNMIIKDISLNYLYVSHPIFVKLYRKVIGLTGTIGDEYDKAIFEKQYNFILKKVPREKANHLIELPMILCDNIEERNEKIVNEVLNFHEKEYPVLVIFQDLNEISILLAKLISSGIKNINIFDGKDEKIRPDLISGFKGVVTLGTNVCGRGTDIKYSDKPLHVIVTYYSSNKRVMDQAFGRTARQGHDGTVRIICLESQFYKPKSLLSEEGIKEILDNFNSRNQLEMEFIEEFRKNREWIFSGEIKSQIINDDVIEIIRGAKINVNRIVACNFEFPLCMSIQTFLLIQAQKIFSLYNCPNCRYTWMIFQKYVREMILASWSLFLEKTEKRFLQDKRNGKFTDFLKSEYKILISWIKEYLPDESDPNNYNIIPTFLHIFQKITSLYEKNVMKQFTDANNGFYQHGKRKFCSISFGFKPYTLISSSGSKIDFADGSDQDRNFIIDPELKYMRKQPNHHPILMSITEKIDDIFNLICNKINEVIGGYIGLKFFLRRTLSGCEFGVCFDFDYEKNKIIEDFSCLIDQDPLFMFSITVKSIIPILAGILIIGLVYIASIAKNIAGWILAFPPKITKELVKKTVIEISKVLLQSSIEKVCDSIIEFLFKVLDNQIKDVEHYKPKIATILKTVAKLASPYDASMIGDKFSDLFDGTIKIKMKSSFATSFLKDNLPVGHLLKIGLLLLLCFSSFMIKFHFYKKSINYNTAETAKKYDDNQNVNESLNDNEKFVNNNDFPTIAKVEIIKKDD